MYVYIYIYIFIYIYIYIYICIYEYFKIQPQILLTNCCKCEKIYPYFPNME